MMVFLGTWNLSAPCLHVSTRGRCALMPCSLARSLVCGVRYLGDVQVRERLHHAGRQHLGRVPVALFSWSDTSLELFDCFAYGRTITGVLAQHRSGRTSLPWSPLPQV